jgi:hypothetical protein
VLVFAKPHSKLQPSQLYVLSGQQHGAVLEHADVHIVTLQVLSCRQPLRVTMVGRSSCHTFHTISIYAVFSAKYMIVAAEEPSIVSQMSIYVALK